MQEDWNIYKKQKNEYDLLSEQYAIGKRLVTGYVGKTIDRFLW